MPATMPCPLCGAPAQYERVPHTREAFVDVEGRATATAQDWHKIYCRTGCRPFAFDESLRDLLDTDSTAAAILSRFARSIHKQTWPYSELIPLELTWGRWIVDIHVQAAQAAGQFGLGQVEVEYAGGLDFDNPLFRVHSDGQTFALRLFDSDVDIAAIHSQDLLLTHFAQDDSLAVPRPLLGSNGDSIQQIAQAESPPRHCALYPWLEGEVLDNIDAAAVTPQAIANFGVFMAHLHDRAASFCPPDWFTLPRSDAQSFAQRLLQHCADKDLSPTQQIQLKDLGAQRLTLMAAWGEGSDVFGPTQPDLSGLNVLVHGETLALIDFQESQWGHYLPNTVQALRRALWRHENQWTTFLQAYQQIRPLPPDFEEYYRLWQAAERLGWLWWD
ncbi:MAG: phosphotransferase [Candidatus Latescibacteria bacterium]|nr:phosphotransferase [Candidatus Latescibacterota bacterium]